MVERCCPATGGKGQLRLRKSRGVVSPLPTGMECFHTTAGTQRGAAARTMFNVVCPSSWTCRPPNACVRRTSLSCIGFLSVVAAMPDQRKVTPDLYRVLQHPFADMLLARSVVYRLPRVSDGRSSPIKARWVSVHHVPGKPRNASPLVAASSALALASCLAR